MITQIPLIKEKDLLDSQPSFVYRERNPKHEDVLSFCNKKFRRFFSLKVIPEEMTLNITTDKSLVPLDYKKVKLNVSCPGVIDAEEYMYLLWLETYTSLIHHYNIKHETTYFVWISDIKTIPEEGETIHA